ncbi:hypothetical protein ABPG72_017861, partial [Tetrahymena utriculariae]
MNQQGTLENLNKVISDILQYNFKEFEKEVEEGLIQQSQDQQPQLNINAIFRTWDNDRFNQANQNLSQNFYENREMILREIEKLNYFICKQFFSQEDKDLFIGYFQNKNGLSCDYIFKIYYCSTLSDIQEEIDYIQKYDKDQNDQECYIQISQSIHILVMPKKTFLLLQSKSKQFQLFSFRYWNKEFFNTKNDDKLFQNKNLQEHRKKCQKCRINKDCNDILNLSKFQLNQTLDDKLLTQLNNSLKKCSNLESLILNLQKESISDEQINRFFEDNQGFRCLMPTCNSMSNDQRYSHMKFLIEAYNQPFNAISIKHKQNEIGVNRNILKEDVISNLINLKQLELNL